MAIFVLVEPATDSAVACTSAAAAAPPNAGQRRRAVDREIRLDHPENLAVIEQKRAQRQLHSHVQGDQKRRIKTPSHLSDADFFAEGARPSPEGEGEDEY